MGNALNFVLRNRLIFEVININSSTKFTMGWKELLGGKDDDISWDSLKRLTFGSKTLEQTWREVFNGATNLFDQGCQSIGGAKSQTGCCTIKNFIKCNKETIEEAFLEIKEKGSEEFEEACEKIGGTVSNHVCTAEGLSVTNALQSASGAAQANIIPMILVVLFMMFVTRLVFTRMN